MQVEEVAHHRNGVSGEDFYVVRFMDEHNGAMIGIVFATDECRDEDGYFIVPAEFHNPRVAILALDKLPSIAFGDNSWRGDQYARPLYEAVVERWGREALQAAYTS